jgi:hypothetical protein
MNKHNESFIRRAYKEQRGQVLIAVLVMLIALCAFTALVVDIGRVYIGHRQLQASTDAAALAGAGVLGIPPNSGAAAITAATSYSGVAGSKNALGTLPNVTMVAGYPKVKCLTTLTNQGISCVGSPISNSIQVRQQVSVPLTFARVFGARSMTVTATATAAMRGASRAPFNVALVVDSTASMGSMDGGNSFCGGLSRERCALQGVRILLGSLSPCGGQANCVPAGGGQVKNAVDQVSLFTFPAVTTATVSNEYDCTGTVTPVRYPLPTGPTYSPAVTSPPSTYQILSFSGDYRASNTANSLNTSSNLVAAAGGKAGCTGLQNPGGQNTYYPGVIYSAEHALLDQQAANPSTDTALIILGDGDANANSSNLPGASTTNTGPTRGVYPSTRQQCSQAVTAAQWAARQVGTDGTPTRVYTVAYGATSSGCSTDTNPHITPCQTMQQMASSPANFYVDTTSSTNGCISAAQPTTNLNQIFTAIAGDMSNARLIPDNLP